MAEKCESYNNNGFGYKNKDYSNNRAENGLKGGRETGFEAIVVIHMRNKSEKEWIYILYVCVCVCVHVCVHAK